MNQLAGSPNAGSTHKLIGAAQWFSIQSLRPLSGAASGRDQKEGASTMRIAVRLGIALLPFSWVWQTALAYDSADSIRCNGSLVTIGDTVEELVQACGEPVQRNGL